MGVCVLIAVCALPFGVAAAQDPDPSISGNCATFPCLTTYHNSNSRAGVNSKETILSASTIPFPTLTGTQVAVDGMVYAQPLYLSSVNFNAGNCTSGSRNIVYVATENNSVYAIDADTYAVCKQVSLNNSGETAIPVTALPTACDNISGSTTYGTVGITSTPVIDPANNVLFVVSAHQVGTAPPYSYTQRLNALDVTTLSPLGPALDLPTIINNHKPSGYPTFYALNENQRPGLLLATSSTTANIYVAWGSFCDSSIASGGYFGLTAEFDYSYATKSLDTSHVEDFYPLGTSAASGGNGGAGIWMSGGAPAADSGGNVYVAVGNGNFEGVNSPLNYGESIVKLGNSLTVEDYYTPNQCLPGREW